ncbi:MAG: ComEC/Rec2 family competence protein [Candidatus Paceibacteria bacterium]
MDKIKLILTLVLIILIGWLVVINIGEIEGWYRYNFAEQERLEVVFLDVGQGDATFFEFSNGEQMLVDCSKDRRVLHGLGKVMWFYDRSLDYLVITHPDLDHYGGCIDVLKRFEVENIIYNGIKKEKSKFWHSFWSQYQRERTNYITIDEPEKLTIASSTIHFLYPDHNLSQDKSIPKEEFESTNNTSIAFTVEYGDNKILLTGDAEKKLERYLADKYGVKLESNIYKMGHHGSDSSSNEFFVKRVKPDISVASAGKDNNFGHPSYRVISRLKRLGSKIWRTDQDGSVMLRVFEDKVQTQSF